MWHHILFLVMSHFSSCDIIDNTFCCHRLLLVKNQFIYCDITFYWRIRWFFVMSHFISMKSHFSYCDITDKSLWHHRLLFVTTRTFSCDITCHLFWHCIFLLWRHISLLWRHIFLLVTSQMTPRDVTGDDETENSSIWCQF